MTGATIGSVSKEQILERLDIRAFYESELPLLSRGREASALCPFHNDRHPSFSVNLETGLWCCHAGCGGGNAFDFVMKRYGMTFLEALQELARKAGMEEETARRVIRSYRWTDAEGHEAWKHRWDKGEKFSWSQDKDAKQCGQGHCRPTLYNLESLHDASEIIIVEGERDVETVNRLLIDCGLTHMRATCTPNGAQSVRPKYLAALHGKAKVWVSGDNDAAGEGYRSKCVMQLHGKVGQLLDLRVPGGSKDWTEWADTKDRTEEFRPLVLNACPMPDLLRVVPWRSSIELLEGPVTEIEWLIDGILPAGAVALLSGREGSMKSWLALRWADAVAEGKPWLGRACRQGDVLYLDGEMPPSLLRQRIREGIGGSENLHVWSWADRGFQFPERLEGDYLELAARSHSLIVVDTLRRFMTDLQENAADDMAKVSRMLRELTRHGAAVLVLHHALKDEDKRGYRGSSELGAGVDITMSLVKKQNQLSLSTEKTRYGEAPKLELAVHGSYTNPEFEDLHSTELTDLDGHMVRLQAVISDLCTSLGHRPNQTEIVQEAEKQGLGKRVTIIKMLKAGEGKYWRSVKSGRKVVYSLSDLSVLSVPIEQEPRQIEERKTPDDLSVLSGGSIDQQTDSELMKRIAREGLGTLNGVTDGTDPHHRHQGVMR